MSKVANLQYRIQDCNCSSQPGTSKIEKQTNLQHDLYLFYGYEAEILLLKWFQGKPYSTFN